MRDIFRPVEEPTRSIYDAFLVEAKRRPGRSVDQWMKAEREAVFNEAVRQAELHGLRAPTMEEVLRAERYAMGSIDYGAKWAYQVIEAMNLPRPASSSRA